MTQHPADDDPVAASRAAEDVTVIIPTHNRRELLHRTLRSVLAQTDVDLTVLVVDDGSAEDVTPSVEALGDARVSVVRHAAPRGVSAARNTGIARATTTWLAFVDDDDLWAPCKLRAQLDALAARPDARWACTGSVNVDLACRISRWDLLPETSDIGDLLLRQNAVPGGGSGVLAARDLVEGVGGFDEAISNLADWDFYIRLGLHAPVAAVDRFDLGYLSRPEGMAHAVLRSEREYAYLDVKYERERRSRGVSLNRQAWLSYLAGLAYGSGQRLTGMRLHSQLVLQEHHLRSLRSILMGVAPEGLRLARARAWVPPTPPPDLQEAAEAWLRPYGLPAAA